MIKIWFQLTFKKLHVSSNLFIYLPCVSESYPSACYPEGTLTHQGPSLCLCLTRVTIVIGLVERRQM